MTPASRLALLSPALLLALLPTWAAAGEPLEPIDTVAGAIPVGPAALPPSEAGLTATSGPQALGDKIIFVNFDGADMNNCGNNDPANNCSTIWNGVVLPFTGDAVQRASIIQVIRSRVDNYGVTVTDTRPQSGDYDMEMVGNWQGQNPDFAGVAPNIDCFDATGGETSFTLEASTSADGIAEIVLQEIAHTWGLEHIDEQSDLLFPTTAGSNKTFRDECYKIVGDTQLNPTNGWCNNVHTNFCSFGWQNSHQELLFLFGPSLPDTAAPAVAIINPSNGAMVDGGDVDLTISLQDDQTPAVIATTIVLSGGPLEEPVETGGSYASPGELTFPIEGLPDGEYTVQVDIEDESDNPASDMITFTVIGNPPAGNDDGAVDDSGGNGDAGGTAGDDGPAGDGGSAGDDAGDGSGGNAGDAGVVDPDPGTPQNCDCTTEPRDDLPLRASGLFALLLLGRRRRRG